MGRSPGPIPERDIQQVPAGGRITQRERGGGGGGVRTTGGGEGNRGYALLKSPVERSAGYEETPPTLGEKHENENENEKYTTIGQGSFSRSWPISVSKETHTFNPRLSSRAFGDPPPPPPLRLRPLDRRNGALPRPPARREKRFTDGGPSSPAALDCAP